MSASDAFRAPIVYPPGFIVAVRPDEVDRSLCDHELGICYCVHDWRIHWGNLPRVSKPRARTVTDSP
ncbi:hypothetical protein MAIC_42970 [Mycolicibacterium aichiense]|uniref:Head-to-tail connector protein n=1 Tax=Mycolicibacterium aichiense TaxID=1799 RepID=A0AAD1HQH3_9MYCO|nr:hypothetical protein SEA_HERBERTWM_16 [Mycobacterium phage Herbertwm]BBX09494.1 hypothetical protein MAIC_42970 [Mycolicibacterium aichiense]SUA14059.1 Uncharacterised protein [Mycolicibacterium aichiense]